MLLKMTHKTRFSELQFTEDTALLATTKAGAEKALRNYTEVVADFGLTVSIPNTKLIVTGRKPTAGDRAVGSYQIECVTEFPYLGSVIASSGRMQPDIDQRISRASRAFGKHYAGQRSEIGTLELKSSLCPLHPAV